jgi:hypothetical protein
MQARQMLLEFPLLDSTSFVLARGLVRWHLLGVCAQTASMGSHDWNQPRVAAWLRQQPSGDSL